MSNLGRLCPLVRSSPPLPPACSRLFSRSRAPSRSRSCSFPVSCSFSVACVLRLGALAPGALSLLASGRRDCVRRRPRADDVTDYSSMPEGPTRRRSQRPPPSLTRGGLSAPRVASATAAAPTRAGTTRAAEQADARSIAAARSSARTGHSTSSDRRSSAEELSGRVQRWRGARQSRVHQPVSGVSRRRCAGRRT